MDWHRIDDPEHPAPRDKHILLYGRQRPHDGINPTGPLVFTGYYDEIDGAWCSTGSTWTGPFYEPTHWRPQPTPPKDAG